MLKEFVEENKIEEYKQRVEERFAHIIRQIGRETNSLIEKEGEISKIITEINNDFVARNFVGAIKSMELKTIESKNKIFNLLVEIKKLAHEGKYDYLVIESTGISEPMPVAETFTFADEEGNSLGQFSKLDTMVTVVDGLNFLSMYDVLS